MDTGKFSIVGQLFFGTLFLCAMVWGFGAYFHGGFFIDPNSIDLASKFLVGILLAGFFLFILFDENEPTPMAE